MSKSPLPRKVKPTSLRLTLATRRRLDALRQRWDERQPVGRMSRSGVIRAALDRGLDVLERELEEAENE